jgi:hypothetical protein
MMMIRYEIISMEVMGCGLMLGSVGVGCSGVPIGGRHGSWIMDLENVVA